MSQNDPQDDRPHAEADDSEQVYFQGSPMLRYELARQWPVALLGFVIALAPIFVKLVLAPDAHIIWWIYLLAIAVGLFVLMSPWIKTKTVRYRITNYRIDFERGLLSRSIDTIELWHVEDLKLHQSFLQRLLDVGQIAIISAEESEPRSLSQRPAESEADFPIARAADHRRETTARCGEDGHAADPAAAMNFRRSPFIDRGIRSM